MDIDKKMYQISDKLKNLKNYNDINGFIYDLDYWVKQMEYFYNVLTPKQGNNPDRTFYKPKKVPKMHQIAYFNLTRGFPKELYGGHWCYVIKNFKSKYLVIPTTSVKKDSAPRNEEFEIDVEAKNFKNEYTTRLQVSDIRTLDAQRLYVNKGFFDVETDREYILSEINRILSFDKY